MQTTPHSQTQTQTHTLVFVCIGAQRREEGELKDGHRSATSHGHSQKQTPGACVEALSSKDAPTMVAAGAWIEDNCPKPLPPKSNCSSTARGEPQGLELSSSSGTQSLAQSQVEVSQSPAPEYRVCMQRCIHSLRPARRQTDGWTDTCGKPNSSV